jgi:endoglucanase
MKRKTINRLMAVGMAAVLTIGAMGCGKGASDPAGAGEAESDAAATEETSQTDEGAQQEASVEESSEETEEKENLVTGENMLENGDFAMGVAPWSYFCQDGACALSINKEGELDIDVKSTGTVSHGVQVYHDGFRLDEGCEYSLEFDGYSTIERPVEMRFQLNGGDYHAYFEDQVPLTPEKEHFVYTFKMNETSDPAPRFCFNSGLCAGMDSGLDEHHIYLDNFVLTLVDASGIVEGSGEIQMPEIAVNQIGYLPGAYKSATLRKGALNQTAKLIDEKTGEAVFEAAIGAGVDDHDSGEKEEAFDFTEVKAEGTYHIEAGDAVSASFRIAADVYDEAFKASIKMLYYQRCGTELTSEYAGDFAHPVCHDSQAVLYEDRSVKLDVSGGWHDAGDYGRYSVAGAKAAADLLLAYENYPSVFGDDIGIPESGNGIPDVLDEARYELDWLFKMQRDDGGVYHKVTCSNFPGEIMPEEETAELIIMPVTTTSTGDFAGVMAIASRVYAQVDQAYADKCLEAAKKAAQYLDVTPRDEKGYKNPEDIATGEYEDEYDVDERFWAYAELFKTTGDKAFEASMMEWIPNNGYTLGWQGVAGYGGYAYLTAQGADKDMSDKIRSSAGNMSEVITTKADKYPYGSSIIGEYPWGSNLTIANNGEFMLMMKGIADNYNKTSADKQLNYLFGNNATGYCFLTGFGTIYSDHPHHRPSQAMGKTVPGMVVGGPNSGLNDPYVQNVLRGKPSAKCYADNAQSYSTNEITIYWNSPLIYLLAGELAETK